MESFQYITIMIAIISASFALYRSMKDEAASIRENMNRMDNKFLALEEKFETRFLAIETRFLNIESRFIAIDEKWERLFEKLLLKN